MKSFFLLSFIVSLYSCKDDKRVSIAQPTESIKDTSAVIAECVQKDTVTKLGTQIHYLNKNGKFQVKWGDNNYSRTYDSLFTCDYDTLSGVWDFVPKYNFETLHTLVLTDVLFTSSGGNPAPLEFSAIVFPKNSHDSVYSKDFFIDCSDDYLLYGDMNNEDNIHILNLETKKEQVVILKPKQAVFRSPTLSIKETKIDNDTLSIKYEVYKEHIDTAVFVTNKFRIKI